MTCDVIELDGRRAIVCHGHKRVNVRCACGKPATAACDWKLNQFHRCDERLCDDCRHRVGKKWQSHPLNVQPGLFDD